MDFESAGLEPRHLALLRYAARLTRESRADRSDIEDLRGAGFSDADILGICEVTSYFAYANRIVGGLGVALEGV